MSYQDAYPFAGVIPISAKDKENLNEVLNVLEETLPEGPQYFPEDMITDQPERLIILILFVKKSYWLHVMKSLMLSL